MTSDFQDCLRAGYNPREFQSFSAWVKAGKPRLRALDVEVNVSYLKDKTNDDDSRSVTDNGNDVRNSIHSPRAIANVHSHDGVRRV